MQDMRRKQNRMLLPQTPQQLAHPANLSGIKTIRRLIQYQQFRAVNQRIRKRHPLLKPLRKIPDHPPPNIRHRAKLHHLACPMTQVAPTQAFQLRSKVQVLLHPHIMIKRRHFGHVTYLPSHLQRLPKHIMPIHHRHARRRRHIPTQNSHGRRLPRPVGTQKTHNLSRLHIKRQPIHSRASGVLLG